MSLTAPQRRFREALCADCPTPCSDYQEVRLDHGDPCAACPLGLWLPRGCIGEPPRPPISPIRPTSAPRRNQPRLQPGDVLAAVIKQVTGEESCSPCDHRRRTMNEWGWVQCWLRRETIIAWLVEEATKRGVQVTRSSIAALLQAAFLGYARTRRGVG